MTLARSTGTQIPVDRAVVKGRTIRPCMVSYFFPPNYSGSALQALNLSEHLRRLDIEPFIVTANLSGSPSQDIVRGVPVYRVAVTRSPSTQIPAFWWSVARFLWRRRSQFDIIHAHGTLQHGVVSLLGRLLGKPTILKVAMADSDIAFERQGRVMGSIGRFTVERFDRYIATTDAIGAEFQRQGLDVGRVRRIPNGVDTDVYSPVADAERECLRLELGLPRGPLVTCVAIIQPRKNIDGVLRIWQSVVARGGPGHLVLVGPVEQPDGPFIRSLHEFVETHRLQERVSFLGQRDQVAPLLKVSDVFLFPSSKEGMPNAVLEALACGVPCLVSSTAGVAGLIADGINGYSVDTADEQTFASRLLSVLRDERFRHHLGENARNNVVEHFSLTRVADRYRRLYQELLDREGVE